MPIKPSQLRRYPANWREIARACKERAGWACEGSPAYPDCRAAHGKPHPVTGSRVILTCAHLDHTPEHCEDANLKAWCQRCHLTYDAALHAANAKATKARTAARKAKARERAAAASARRRAAREAGRAAFVADIRQWCAPQGSAP